MAALYELLSVKLDIKLHKQIAQQRCNRFFLCSWNNNHA